MTLVLLVRRGLDEAPTALRDFSQGTLGKSGIIVA
jgi:hypothetical protein